MLAAGLNPFANMRQVFQPDAAPGALRLYHESLRYAVVLVFLKPLLFAGKFAKTALGSFRSAPLQTFSPIAKPLPNSLDIFPAVGFAVAVRGDIDYPEIDAKHLGGQDWISLIDVADAGEIELATHKHQIDLALPVSKQIALSLSHGGFDLKSAAQRPYRNNVLGLEAHDALIVGLCRMLTKGPLNFLIKLVGIRRLGDAADRNLCTQSEPGADIHIPKLVQIEHPQNAGLKAYC
jgi:hypothetical protein